MSEWFGPRVGGEEGCGKREHCNSALRASDSNNLFSHTPLPLLQILVVNHHSLQIKKREVHPLEKLLGFKEFISLLTPFPLGLRLRDRYEV